MMKKIWWGSNWDASNGVNWMRWERISVRKEVRGRGFRNLHPFNIALLAKLGCRLIVDPEALMCRILKVRYYNHGDFFTSSSSSRSYPNYTWTSIPASQHLLRVGVRWKIVTGNYIKIWGMPWLNDDSNFYI